MLNNIIEKLNPYAWTIKIGLMAIVVIYIFGLHLQMASLKNDVTAAELATKNQELITQKWQLAHKTLHGQVRDQNAAIKALAEAGKRAEKLHAEAIKKQASRVRVREGQINAAGNRAQIATTCEQAVQQVQNELKAGML